MRICTGLGVEGLDGDEEERKEATQASEADGPSRPEGGWLECMMPGDSPKQDMEWESLVLMLKRRERWR